MNRVDQSQASICGTGHRHTHRHTQTQSRCRRPSALRAVGLEKRKTKSKKMEYGLKKLKNGRRPQVQLNKTTLIGCDIIVN